MKVQYILFAFVLFASCGSGSTESTTTSTAKSNPIDLATKRIKQRIDADGMGMLQNVEVVEVEQQNDSTFKATHTFLNPVMNKEVKLTRVYTLNVGLDSVLNKEDVGNMYLKSEGEWIESGM